jgi:phytoene synthase
MEMAMVSSNQIWTRIPSTEDWEHCRDIARHHGKSFFLASRMLPAARRRAVLAAYAYCRIADDIVDRAVGEEAGPARDSLAAWMRQLREPRHPVAVAFAHTRQLYNIPAQPILDLLAGVEMDLTTTRYKDWNALHDYCYRVAGTVGLIVAPIFGCEDEAALRHAADLGIAMQLTNILRDVREDADMGRLYLPLEEIEAFGLDPDAIMAGRPGPGFADLMAFQISRARALYASAMIGIPALIPSGRMATLAASQLYARILDQIEAVNFDVCSGRVYVGKAGKAVSLSRATASFVRMAPVRRPQSRIHEVTAPAHDAWRGHTDQAS